MARTGERNNAKTTATRKERLAAALRENLRRRKAQVRRRDVEKQLSGEQLREPEAGSKR